MKKLIITFVILSSVVFFIETEGVKTTKATKISNEEKQQINNNKSETINAIPEKNDSLESIKKSIIQIENIKFLIENFRIDNYQENIKGISAIIKLFSEFEEKIDENKKSDVDSIRLKAEKVSIIIKTKRNHNWPTLRRLFGEILAKEVWIHDMYVSTKGTRHTTIEFISKEYSQNRNIQTTQDDLRGLFNELRFKKVIYKTNKNDTEYTVYNIHTREDIE